MGSDAWTERFQSRTDYSACTDVPAAFRLAARHLEGDPGHVGKHLFVFSDLIDQPPTDSVLKPGKISKEPAGDFPWEKLKDVSVSVFWVPPDQKLAWLRAVRQHQLAESFALYTTSESSLVEIAPPERPVTQLTAIQRKAEQQRYLCLAKKIGMGTGICILALCIIVTMAAICLSFARRRRLQRNGVNN